MAKATAVAVAWQRWRSAFSLADHSIELTAIARALVNNLAFAQRDERAEGRAARPAVAGRKVVWRGTALIERHRLTAPRFASPRLPEAW